MAVTTSWHMEVGDDSRIYLMKGEEKMNAEGNYRMEGDRTSDPLQMSTTTQNQIKHICWYGKYCSVVACYSVVLLFHSHSSKL